MYLSHLYHFLHIEFLFTIKSVVSNVVAPMIMTTVITAPQIRATLLDSASLLALWEST